MRNTRLAGHGLMREGRPYFSEGCGECLAGSLNDWYGYEAIAAAGYGGHGRCSCGAQSPCLDTDAARKRWHAEHKNHIREGQG